MLRSLSTILIFIVFTSLAAPGFYLTGRQVFVSAQQPRGQQAVPGEVLVKVKGKNKVYRLSGPAIDDQFVLKNFQANSQIEYVEPNYMIRAALIPDDPDFIQQYYLRQVEAPGGWDITTGKPEVVVAVLDSGFDINHPDLKHNFWVNEKDKPYDRIDNDGNGKIDDFYGWNFIENNNDITPKFTNFSELGINHGTVVAGILAARGNNNYGIVGGGWQLKIMGLKVLDSLGRGNSFEVAEAIDYAVAQGADVINLSIVGTNYSQTLEQAIARAFKSGLVVVAAAGNEIGHGQDMDLYPAYPVCNDGNENMVIGVVAVDRNNRRAGFSNYGKKCSDVAAPGVNFYSTVVYNDLYPGFNSYFKGGYSGTSVATPLVSALAALIKSVNPNLSAVQIRNIIINTTTDIDKLNPGMEGKLGSGLINYKRALGAARATLTGVSSPIAQDWIVSGAGPGGGPHVRVFDFQENVLAQFFAYHPAFRGGVSVASGDVDGDGQDEIITVPYSDMESIVKIFDINGNLRFKFLAYADNFKGGARVAVGDVDGNGTLEIITGAGPGGGPHVRVFSRLGRILFEFFAYHPAFRGGVSVASGDVDGDGQDEIITGAGPGGGPHIRVFSRQGQVKAQFFAYHPAFRGGVSVASGDVDGDGQDEIITGAGPGGGPHLIIYNYRGQIKNQFFVFDPESRSGINVAAGDIKGDGVVRIVVAPAKAAPPQVRIFDQHGKLLDEFFAYHPAFRGGVNLNIIKR